MSSHKSQVTSHKPQGRSRNRFSFWILEPGPWCLGLFKRSLCIAALFFFLSSHAKVDTVLVQDFSFSPAFFSICQGDTIRFVWVSGTHNVHILSPLDSTSGDLLMSGDVFEFVPPFAGFYDFQCDYHSGMMTAAFMVNAAPNANIGGDVTFCGGGTLDAGIAGMNYVWNTGETTQTISVSSAGTYYVTVSDTCGSSSDTVNVTINPNPVIPAIGSPTICAGASATLSASGGVSYFWLPGNQTTQSIVVSPPATSFYTVTVTDANGCSALATATVNITFAFTVSVTPTDASCDTCADGSAVSSIVGGTAPFTYLWSPGGQTSPAAAGLLPGTYTLCVTDGSGCVDCETTFIAPVCDTAITTFAGGNRQDGNIFDVFAKTGLVVTGFDCNVANDSDGVAVIQIFYRMGSYLGFDMDSSGWSLLGTDTVTGVAPTGTPTPLNVPVNVPVAAGQTAAFYITISANTASDNLEYTNGPSAGSAATENSDIRILQGIGKQYPFGATFPATGSGSRIFNGTVHYCLSPLLGTENFQTGNEVLVYPNPTTGKVNWIIGQFENLKIKTCEVFNIYGERVLSFQINSSSNFEIDLSAQPAGVYFVKVKMNSRIAVRKIMKE